MCAAIDAAPTLDIWAFGGPATFEQLLFQSVQKVLKTGLVLEAIDSPGWAGTMNAQDDDALTASNYPDGFGSPHEKP